MFHKVTGSTKLGALPFTYNSASESWTTPCYDIVVDGKRWTVQGELDDERRIKLYLFDDDGNDHSRVGYAPRLSLGEAAANTLAR